jgi:DHA2 family multidrug resistance protein
MSILLCTNISLTIAPTTLIVSNLLFGIGSVMALVPISGLALGTLPKDEIANAAGIHSLTKCVAGSVFTSLASSFAISFSQVHQTYLVKNMSIYNPNFAHRINALKGFFMHNSAGIIASRKANVLLYKQLIVQSKLCAFVDLFQFFALATFLVIPLVLLLKLSKKPTDA